MGGGTSNNSFKTDLSLFDWKPDSKGIVKNGLYGSKGLRVWLEIILVEKFMLIRKAQHFQKFYIGALFLTSFETKRRYPSYKTIRLLSNLPPKSYKPCQVLNY